MKKILLLAVCASILLALCSCQSQTTNLDISKKNNIYDDMAEYIANPTQYEGKTITLSAECSVVYNFSKNKIARRTIVVHDDDSDMRALYEIRKNDGKYPKSGTTATVVGKFTGGYIDVSEFRNVTYDNRSFDIEAIEKSSVELKQFINDFRALCNDSEHYQKSIRIYGNIAIKNGYTLLLGLDEKGSHVWDIELQAKDDSVKLPSANTEHVNTYEICGTLEMYLENNIAYGCINVSEITPVEGVLKVDEENSFSPVVNPFS